jgi:hypothetical protein
MTLDYDVVLAFAGGLLTGMAAIWFLMDFRLQRLDDFLKAFSEKENRNE